MNERLKLRGKWYRVVWSLKEWRQREQTIIEALMAEQVRGRKLAVERETDRYWWNHRRRA